MNLWLRSMLFGVVTVGAVLADQTSQSSMSQASASAAVAQVNGDPIAAQNLDRLRQRGTWIDLAAGASVLLAGVACFATWRPAPRTTVVDHRASFLQKESV